MRLAMILLVLCGAAARTLDHCEDYHRSHRLAIDGDRRPDDVMLSVLDQRSFARTGGTDVRPDR